MSGNEPTPHTLKQAKRHVKATEAHGRKVAQLQAQLLDEQGESANAAIMGRDAAREEWDRAAASQRATRGTEPKVGETAEIPTPRRDLFLRKLEKVAPRSRKRWRNAEYGLESELKDLAQA